MSVPRVLAIMGSGETAPTMAKVHRALFDRLGPGQPADRVPAAIIDTPYGFQENADQLSARTVEFFATSVGRPVAVASLRRRDVDAISAATALARIREARYVMAGPGSPTYALRHWSGGPIPDALVAKLAPNGPGGVVTMASAAALTIGISTIPVYEIYKAGEDPRWVDGLDLLGAATGLRAAVVPHYDNAEGGTHDTRFCYLGERRLRTLEAMLPEGAFVLGVDSHTALVLDLESGLASVAGLGGVTVRVNGRSSIVRPGAELRIEALGEAAAALAAGGGGADIDGTAESAGAGGAAHTPPGAPLGDTMAELEGSFVAALAAGDTGAAVAALLDLDTAIAVRVRGGEDSPDLDNASATFRALITRLGERASGLQDARAVMDPLVAALLEVRDRARGARDWEAADRVRDRLASSGVEVRDGPDGPSWLLSERPAAPPPGELPG